MKKSRIPFLGPGLSALLLAAGMALGHTGFPLFTHSRLIELLWYVAAFLPVGLPVLGEALGAMRHGDFFNELTLMTIACIGAFCIGEYPEAVGVMLFYSVGETLQGMAVGRATRDISRLLDVRPDVALVVSPGGVREASPADVHPGSLVEVRPGCRVPLDGVLESDSGVFDTSALTGESVPRTIPRGGEVLAGMICGGIPVRMRVSRDYSSSALSRILEMVTEASGRKARTELFIRRFARVYTPVVLSLAALLVAVPWLVSLGGGQPYSFGGWLYRALVFLVVSCPCALVISVPLAYFAGIGAASRLGILCKGGNYLEALARITTVAFDKTGTLTTGTFSVTRVESAGPDPDRLLALMAAAEQVSGHPLARALVGHTRARGIVPPKATDVREIPGWGIEATAGGCRIVVGNARMLGRAGINMPDGAGADSDTVIACGIDGRYAGRVFLADTLKPEAVQAIDELRAAGVRDVVILSGDRPEAVESVARSLGVAHAQGGLLPADKVSYVGNVVARGAAIAFVGDGMNDAPVLAMSSVGIAMGGLGSDAAIGSADVVIQTDNLRRVATAIRLGRRTRAIVLQNITGAIAVKCGVLVLGALGLAGLWGAVFADVGVALLAVLNSMRVMLPARRKF